LKKVFQIKMQNGAYCYGEIFFYEKSKILHILDLNYENTMTVTNAIDDDFIDLLRRTYKLGDINLIYLYHTDASISKWQGGFKNINADDDNKIHNPFLIYINKYKNTRRQGGF